MLLQGGPKRKGPYPVPSKGLAKLCPPGGTLRSALAAVSCPGVCPHPRPSTFSRAEKRGRENWEKMNHLKNEKQEG